MSMIQYTSDIDDVIFFPNLVRVPSSPSKQIVQIKHVLPDVIENLVLEGEDGFCKLISSLFHLQNCHFCVSKQQ